MADVSTELRETERRVLGNLPAYRTAEGHEAAIAEAIEYGTIESAKDWPKGRTVADLTARLTKDWACEAIGPDYVDADGEHPKLRARFRAGDPSKAESEDPEFVEWVLGTLVSAGLADQDGDIYAMTEAGLAALTA